MLNAFTILHTKSPECCITLDKDNPLYDPDKALTRFKLDSVEYVRKSEVARVKKARQSELQCWKFGEALVREVDKKDVYYCYDCERQSRTQKLPVLNGTRGARYHMETVHMRDPDTGELKQTTPAAKTFFSLVVNKDFDVFKQLLIRWFVCCQLAFFMLENMMFRDFITYLNESLGALLPRAASTLRLWIMEEYKAQKQGLKDELLLAKSKIHLSFDIWTAGNWIAIISIWGYWIDRSGNRQRRLLAFRRIYRSHSGENQAEVLLAVITEYEIASKVGYLVADNASSNDSAATIVLQRLYPEVALKDRQQRRLRCFGHIVNLAAQSLLSASDSEARQAKDDLDLDDIEFERAARAWRMKGPLGKVHRVVKYILGSAQRREEFGDIKGGRKVEQFDHLGVSLSLFW
jgi:hypothetical protein